MDYQPSFLAGIAEHNELKTLILPRNPEQEQTAEKMEYMQLVEVSDAATAKKFIQVNVELNKKQENYIRPLDKDINEVFDKNKNKTFRWGECTRWILVDEQGNLIGRVAAFVNKKYRNKGDDIGFFDCIPSQEAADMLFDVARHWLLQRGMEAMDGPINFGERDRWWGLVVEGFIPPMYCMNFNPPYYQRLFETYGFKPFFHQVCVGMHPKDKMSDKLYARHKMYADDPAFSARHLDKRKLEKFAADFATVYNKAWAGHGGMKEMKKEHAVLLFRRMKPVMDERVVWFAYHQGEPIAIFINLPDLNQYFKHLNGKFGLLQKLYFLWLQKTRPNTKLAGLVFGVVPEFQGKGIDAYIIIESAKIIQHQTAYTDYEMQWIGDFNPKMLNIAESLTDTHRSRVLTTYRYLFDRTREFKRHPLI
jgi:ribosomal protein L13